MAQHITPIETKAGFELDFRSTPWMGDELKENIRESVYKTQHPFMKTLPSRVSLTYKQFASLTDPVDALKIVDRIWYTDMNAMDIDVDVSNEDPDFVAKLMGEAGEEVEEPTNARRILT